MHRRSWCSGRLVESSRYDKAENNLNGDMALTTWKLAEKSNDQIYDKQFVLTWSECHVELVGLGCDCTQCIVNGREGEKSLTLQREVEDLP